MDSQKDSTENIQQSSASIQMSVLPKCEKDPSASSPGLADEACLESSPSPVSADFITETGKKICQMPSTEGPNSLKNGREEDNYVTASCNLVIRFKGITVTVDRPEQPPSYETFGKKILSCLLDPFKFCKKKQSTRIKVLNDVSGYIMPGSMTLILGPPGSGKSTLLKILAGKFRSNKLLSLEGEVIYNNTVLTPEIVTRRPISYISGDHNVHLPVLTVRETLDFAEQCTRCSRGEAVTIQMIRSFAPELLETKNPYLEFILQSFGLKTVENEVVGGEDIKDSEKTRLTTAEIAMGTYSVMLYDQPGSGQDSLLTFDTLQNLLHTVVRIQQCAIVSVHVQVSPEVFNLFDRLILLSEGQVIYQGPREVVEEYFSCLGYHKPASVDTSVYLQDIAAGEGARYVKPGLSTPNLDELVAYYKASDHCKDIFRILASKEVMHASWVETASDIELTVQNTSEGADILVTGVSISQATGTNGSIHVGDKVAAVLFPDGGIHYAGNGTSMEQGANKNQKIIDLLKSTQGLVRLQLERGLDKRGDGGCYKKRFRSLNVRNWLLSTRCLIKRQIRFTFRLKIMLILRLMQVVILGLFGGSLFYRKGGKVDQHEMISLRTIGFISMLILMLISLIQLPVHILIHRPVFHKQQAQHFFPVSSYVVAHGLVSLPQSFLEAFIYSMCVYFLANLSHRAIHYFQYLALIFLTAYVGACFVLLVSAIAPLVEVGGSLAGLFIALSLLFSGTPVLPSVMPAYWKWMLYINPFRWGNIIFSSTQMKDRYQEPCSSYPGLQFCLVSPRLTVGSAFLKFYVLEAGGGKLLLSYMAIVLFILAINLLAYLAYRKISMPDLRPSIPREQVQAYVHSIRGGSDMPKVSDLSEAENGRQGARWVSHSLPVKPIVLSFHNLRLVAGQHVLLDKVSGYAKPGEMLALIGSTRSGKTTLLKCIAGRLPPGKLEGDILVNGTQLNKASFCRISGFAEKVEAHQPFLTVRESLEFSASLRLGRHVNSTSKALHVDLVLELMGLSHVSDKLVESFRHITCRTKEITKKLSVAIELAANPSILFLDDPTAQLDGVGTRHVLQLLQTVARIGRTLILTLHHPSGEALSFFDAALILRLGQQVYFGPAGQNGSHILDYFASVPNVPSYDQRRSPVVFMLDILGGGMRKREPVADFALAYRESALHKANLGELETLRNQKKDSDLQYLGSGYAASYTTQARMVFLRNERFLWRNVRYTYGRLTAIVAVALIMGTLYLRIDLENSKSMQSGGLIMFFQIILIFAITVNNMLPQVGTDRLIYHRESRARMYAPILYPASWVIAEIPYILLATLLFVGIANAMAGIGVASFSIFIRYWVCLFLFTMVVICYGMFLACATPMPMMAAACGTVLLSVWISSSGVSIPRYKIRFYKWLYWINPFQYCLNILTSISFFCDTKTPACLSCTIGRPCPGCSCKRIHDLEKVLEATYGPVRSQTTPAVFVWDRLQLIRVVEKQRNHWDFLALGGMALFFAALAFASFVWLKHNRSS